MATEVLRPQNFLVDRMRDSPAVFQRLRNSYFSKHNGKYSRRLPKGRPGQRKRFGGSDKLRTAKGAASERDMDKVTILRRGEPLNSIIKSERSPIFKNNEGEMTAHQNPLEIATGDVYAGSATSVGSPAPSSLPLPSFSRKVKNQVATRDLRRLLRLEL